MSLILDDIDWLWTTAARTDGPPPNRGQVAAIALLASEHLRELMEIRDAADAVCNDAAAGINDGKAMTRLRIALGREVAP